MKLSYLKILRFFGVGLLTATILVSCARQVMITDFSKKTKVMGNQSFALSENEIPVLQKEALGGAPEPAFRLHLFYELYRMDFSESMFWVQIAAENGHPGGEYNFGAKLHEDPEQRNRQRARFWLERAAQHGETLAEDLLRELPK